MAKRILVVDDEKGINDLLRKILSKEGFEVSTCRDGAKALDLAKNGMPDLIILDWMMPGMDGGRVLTNLSEDVATRKIPVIVLSGAISEERVVRHDGMIGGHIFMSKTIDIMELVKAIKKVLGFVDPSSLRSPG